MENTAKNFALQLGSLIALYISLGALLALLFGIINTTYPDPAQGFYAYDSAASSIRFSLAVLIVFFPTYLALTRFVNVIRRTEQGTYLTLTKWLIYLSLLIGGAVILGDLVAIINSFLNGELITRFILKALSVLVVVGAAFFYYLLDARGYWQAHERRSLEYGGATLALVIAIVILGFFNTETPTEVREMRIDEQQLQDLNDIQWRIEEYYRVNTELPQSIDEVYTGIEPPQAFEGRSAYEYSVIGDDTFELCAEFSHPSDRSDHSFARPIVPEKGITNPFNWDHGVGRWCFERLVQI